MDNKPSVWQGLLIGSMITPICLHLQYPFNLGVMVLSTLGLFVYLIKDRKEYNAFNFAGMTTAIIGSMVVAISTTGKAIGGISIEMQLLSSLGMLFIGIILIGVGNHIRNPEKVPIKVLYLGTTYFCFIIGVYWFLFYW